MPPASSPGYPLFDFAYVKIEDRVEELASIAAPEDWDYRHTANPHPRPVLRSYLHYTFRKVQDEGKITYTPDKKKAIFNTGLVTDNMEEIYGHFVPNAIKPDPPYYLQRFCKESDRQLLDFGKLPAMAHYFANPQDLLYDTNLELRKNIDHIIDDNKERFPEPFKSMTDNFQLRIALEGAIDHAVKRVQRNYKTAIPQYYQGRLQLLLPLCMTNKKKADLALVIYRQADVYLASTCLTLDMAYNNARLLTRPDSEWLSP